MKNASATQNPICALLLLTGLAFTGGLQAETAVDPPAGEAIKADTDIRMISPTNTWYGTRGLSQTPSAEALGEGRLIFGLHGGGYRQQKVFPGAPNMDADIYTGVGAVSYGLSPYVDIFASMAAFGSSGYESGNASGIGSMSGGLQGTLPFPPTAPIRMAAQVAVFNGLSENQINDNGADGFNYMETRTGLDFMAKLIQTLAFGSEYSAFKLHVNEGMVTSIENGTEALMLLAAGIQFNLNRTVLGLELNSRTFFDNIDMGSDPLWITPSLQFRTAYNVNATLGADFGISQDRTGTDSRGVEPFRLFAGMAFTFDTQFGARQNAKEKAQLELFQRSQLEKKNRELAENLAKKAREDSLVQAKLKAEAEELALKARNDSLALVAVQKRLEEEKARRSDAEKQLLSTGLLQLDAVYFETGKTDVSINSKPYLNIIGKMLAKYPKLKIEVAGHTDNVGNDTKNLQLSQHRSEAVASYLSQAAPELRSALVPKGYGEARPKADNTSPDGRKFNRRTELEVINKEALAEYNR